MRQYSKSLAGVIGLALFIAVSVTHAADLAHRERYGSLRAPLTAESFTAAVLARNASLSAMRQALVAAVSNIRPAGALPDPMLSVSAAPRTFGSATGMGEDIEVSQALPWWGTLAARKEIAQADADVARHDLEALRLRLVSTARGVFADWVFVHRALAINAANQSVLAEIRRIASVRYATGKAPQADVLQAEVERTELAQQQLEWQRKIAVVAARMNALLDRPPTSPIPLPAALPAPAHLPSEAQLLQRALTHPQIKALEAQEHAALAKAALAGKQRYPQFQVNAGYNSMWSDPAMRPMVGLSFTVPLDQGKYRAEIDAAHAQARRAEYDLENQRAALLADLSGAYASTREASKSLALYRDDLVPLARDALGVALSEYGSGRGGFLEVLTAEQHQLDTALGLARARSEYFDRWAELERLSGSRLARPNGTGTSP
ncbi:MAG: TolC family protein [Proteobacteria bacterium]|nr:TolC family protein [Pseudomonadota bacterium]